MGLIFDLLSVVNMEERQAAAQAVIRDMERLITADPGMVPRGRGT